MQIARNPKKILGLFSLVMINVVAVDSLRSLPISAEFGFSLVFFYILGAILFLIPVALVTAELATGWPETGGIYIWVNQAFGKRLGFLVIWLQWFYNIVWYPTIMSLMAATLAYLFDPALATHKFYLWSVMMGMFWLATWGNAFGMKLSSFISAIATIFGTLLPIFFIITLGVIWWAKGKPLAIDLSWKSFFPSFKNMQSLALLSSVLFGLIGLEMSAVHAGEVKDPQKSYPKALLISVILIITTLTLGSLSIALVIPQDKIQLASGLIEGFRIFFVSFNMPWMTPLIVLLIILGGIGTVSAWIIGPSKGIMVAAQDQNAPKCLAKQNRHGAPSNTLLIQAVIFSVLSTLFIFMPSINSAFVLLSAMTAELALMVYLLIFSAAIRLRYKYPNQPRKYRVPYRNGSWLLPSRPNLHRKYLGL